MLEYQEDLKAAISAAFDEAHAAMNGGEIEEFTDEIEVGARRSKSGNPQVFYIDASELTIEAVAE